MFQLHCGNILDVAHKLPIIHCVVTSPPYFAKRQYGESQQEIGQEQNLDHYIQNLVDTFNTIPLHPRGSVWVNLGDTRDKNNGLLMVPEQFALAMKRSDWTLIDNVIWAKVYDEEDGSVEGNCMVEPAPGRLNGNGYEYLYRFVKCRPANKAWVDPCAVRIPRQEMVDGEPTLVQKPYLPSELMSVTTSIEGRCLHNVWRVGMGQTKRKHYAVYPPALCERPIAMTCPMRVCSTCGHLRSRVVEMQIYDEGRGSKRIFGKYTSEQSLEQLKELSGRQDAGKSYIPKKPVTKNWDECDHKTWEPGTVLDPFVGSGSTAEVALKLGRRFIGVDLYQNYVQMTEQRCQETLRWLQDNQFNPSQLEN